MVAGDGHGAGMRPMQDVKAHPEKLRSDAEDCALISKRATDPQKCELFATLSEHLNRLALEVERALAEKEKAKAVLDP